MGWWDYRFDGFEYRTLGRIEGSVSLFFRHTKSLPGIALWRFKRVETIVADSALTATISTGSDKKLAGTKFLLADVLYFANDAKSLEWSFERLPRKGAAGERLLSGTTDLSGLREAEALKLKAITELALLQDRATEKCPRRPIYYDPNAEI